ncbi:TetR/AcrR family transcriptional regulator [Halocynthiibacter sp. C4]|uniref:TetR/AcrR family transcriptional regulator n=1 Tax=Halocynthiibacter sp. C4 TaxID=2992758 RepID=UPI00237AF4DF|nr:TetR/AcrR family transcriptional regulator [Halocynthiibacter sp. C4]MDE0590764.1 TetR/AcrR family transcriptional regulator [Halocynthiibacter sp. C4]
MAKQRVTKEDWIEIGFNALIESGYSALRAESLCKSAGTTKGSFYWHFEDLPDYKSTLLDHWKSNVIQHLDELKQEDNAAPRKLEKLAKSMCAIEEPMQEARAERAIRAWALEEPIAEAAIAETDSARKTYASVLLSSIGLSNPEITEAMYATFVGLNESRGQSDVDQASIISTLLAAFIALAES